MHDNVMEHAGPLELCADLETFESARGLAQSRTLARRLHAPGHTVALKVLNRGLR